MELGHFPQLSQFLKSEYEAKSKEEGWSDFSTWARTRAHQAGAWLRGPEATLRAEYELSKTPGGSQYFKAAEPETREAIKEFLEGAKAMKEAANTLRNNTKQPPTLNRPDRDR